MKYIKTKAIFEGGNPETKAKLKEKIRDLGRKEDDIEKKQVEKAKKAREEEDPKKSELANLELQKLSLQKQMGKIDMKIAALKLKIEEQKPFKA